MQVDVVAYRIVVVTHNIPVYASRQAEMAVDEVETAGTKAGVEHIEHQRHVAVHEGQVGRITCSERYMYAAAITIQGEVGHLESAVPIDVALHKEGIDIGRK